MEMMSKSSRHLSVVVVKSEHFRKRIQNKYGSKYRKKNSSSSIILIGGNWWEVFVKLSGKVKEETLKLNRRWGR